MSNASTDSSFILQPSSLPVPVPRCPISIRAATIADLPFIDQLQNMHTHMVGWMPRKQLEGKIAAGHVLIADSTADNADNTDGKNLSAPSAKSAVESVGYCIGHDQYFKRDDVGIIYQLNVLPLRQRNLIGASLVKSVFERAAYGCRLFCCWCAQDIQANYFWKSIGFIPLAFRTGARQQQRIHIFWQRRIRENDTKTPYWFPAQTSAGSMREDRLVLPIPPGTDWRDAKPVLLPPAVSSAPAAGKPRALPPTRPPAPAVSVARKVAIVRSQSKHLCGLPPGKAAVITAAGLRYIDRADYVPEPAPVKPKRAPKPRGKSDPGQVAAARELRDRYLEQFNAGLVLADAKYDVSRALESESARPPLLVEQKAA